MTRPWTPLHDEIPGLQTERRAPRAHAGFAALGRRRLPQRASGPSGPARPEYADAEREGFLLRGGTARAVAAAAVVESPRCVAAKAAERTARDVARPLDRSHRDRWRARIDGSRVGTA